MRHAVDLVALLVILISHCQVIVERAEAGETDPLKPALDLFVDFVAIFVRLLVSRNKVELRVSKEGLVDLLACRRRWVVAICALAVEHPRLACLAPWSCKLAGSAWLCKP